MKWREGLRGREGFGGLVRRVGWSEVRKRAERNQSWRVGRGPWVQVWHAMPSPAYQEVGGPGPQHTC